MNFMMIVKQKDGQKHRPKARNIKSLILSFESKWDEREQQFRPAEL